MGTRRYIISDASKMLKVESHVLRYWEEELEIKIPRNEMGHRYYTEENIELLRKIRDLKEQGYGLRTIKMMINGEIDINRSNPNTVNIRNLFDKPKSEKNTFYKEDEEGCNNGVNNKEIMDTKTKDNSGDIEKYRGLENKTSLTESVSSESKMQQFQEIMGNIVSRALEENTESIVTRAINKSTQNMSKEVSDCVSEKVLKGVDYIIRMQDEREEETSCALVIPNVIRSETTITYLGIVDLSSFAGTTIGTLLSQGNAAVTTAPHTLLWPSLFLSLLMISFNLFGNGLRDAFNPTTRGEDD